MARSRNLKPGFFKNEDLAECTPWARLCFAGLWTLADREGRLEDRPKRIKGELFAFDSIEVEPLLAELERRKFIERYAAPDGRPLIQVLQFLKHQNPHHREPDSELPPPKSLGLSVHAKTPEPEAADGLHDGEAPGEAEAGPGLDPPRDDLARGSSRADSGTLIPDTGENTSSAEPTGKTDQGHKPTVPCPYREIVGAYHDALPTLPRVRVFDGKLWDARCKAMRGLWGWVLSSRRADESRRATNADEALNWIRDYFARAAMNDFVMGRTPRAAEHKNWRCDLDFLLTSNGLKQVLEKTEAAA